MNLERNTVPCFVTPIVNYHWSDSAVMNEALSSAILALESSDPGVKKSNVGGWHSQLNFLELEDSAIRELRGRLEEFASALIKQFSRQGSESQDRDLRLEGWANVLRHGQYNSVHSHPNALWSLVYYVSGNDAPSDQPFSGRLELLDPRPGASLTYEDDSALYGRLLFNPRPGQVVAFPAWLQHQVHPHFGDAPRISIAVNVLP